MIDAFDLVMHVMVMHVMVMHVLVMHVMGRAMIVSYVF